MFLDATVPPLAAALIVREFWRFLNELEVRGQNLILVGQEPYGREVLRAVRTIKAAGHARLEAARAGSVDGTTEPPRSAIEESSVASSSVSGLTAGEVATRYGVSPSYVRRCCRQAGSGLVATKRGREWVVDEVSAAEWFSRREERSR